jgi:hypothetical protein
MDSTCALIRCHVSLSWRIDISSNEMRCPACHQLHGQPHKTAHSQSFDPIFRTKAAMLQHKTRPHWTLDVPDNMAIPAPTCRTRVMSARSVAGQPSFNARACIAWCRASRSRRALGSKDAAWVAGEGHPAVAFLISTVANDYKNKAPQSCWLKATGQRPALPFCHLQGNSRPIHTHAYKSVRECMPRPGRPVRRGGAG